MLHSALGCRGAVSAPQRAAALAGRDVLEAGGTAVEAMLAAAATIAVTYPHMNGIGGDGFWLIHRP
ncbi:MAG TPA: gamma-glutamyltransferase, partial [Paracoccaceae bacterium]|nr:gamma-glutamyltransferase [Paracoccaceae bacterium]